MKSSWSKIVALLLLSIVLGGCSRLMGGLRSDMDDGYASRGPTTGGMWTERGLLSEDMEEAPMDDRYGTLGHSERSPASEDYRGDRGSWVDEGRRDANSRDSRRASEYSDYRDDVGPLADAPKSRYKKGNRATRSDFVDESANESSLWAGDGQTNFFFTKNKVRGLGDIVTVQVENDLLRDVNIEIARTLTEQERELEIEAAQERLADEASGQKGKDSVGSSSAAPQRSPAGGNDAKEEKKQSKDVEVRKATAADIDLSKSVQLKAGDTIMAEIIDRYPNGNYKIRGVKKIPYRGGVRLVQMTAIVRSNDITEEDTIPSGKFYEYRLEATR